MDSNTTDKSKSITEDNSIPFDSSRNRNINQTNTKARKEHSEFEEKVLQIARITRVVKGGRRLRFRAAVVIGNKKGQVGFAISKAGEVQKAIQKAVSRAKNHLITVPITEKNHSVPHIINERFAATTVLLKPASTGTSLIAGSTVRAILDLAGYQNVISKTIGSTCKINTAYATIKCLGNLSDRLSDNHQHE